MSLVAAGAAVLHGLPTGEDDGRIVRRAVATHALPAEELPPVVPPDAAAPRRSFSDIARSHGWRPTGARADRVEGRAAATVFWERGGRRVAYTLLAGPPVGVPPGSRRTGRRGVLLQSFEHDGRTAVMWTEDGSTSVISSAGIPRARLYDLAGGPPAPDPSGG